jgi:hypothetical protein
MQAAWARIAIVLVSALVVAQVNGLHHAPVTKNALLRLARQKRLPAAVATTAAMFTNAATVLAVSEPVDVFRPLAETSSFSIVYVLGAVVPYFVFNQFIAPALGMVKEVPEDDGNGSDKDTTNKTPF